MRWLAQRAVLLYYRVKYSKPPGWKLWRKLFTDYD